MRERVAITVCLLALGLSLGLSALFGVRHNPSSTASQLKSAGTLTVGSNQAETSQQTLHFTDAGQTIFEEQKCSNCHSIGGKGNPRYPLDGIGSRMNAIKLQEWITGTGSSTNRLSAIVIRRKERYRTLPEREIALLVDYLVSLKSEGHSTEVP